MENEPRAVPFSEAFRFWLKLGFISFGGPAGQIAIMHRELVDKRRWLGDERFLHALNFCMLLPGPEAQQLAIYIGWLMHRTIGGIVAGLFFVLPSVFIMLALSYVYAAYGKIGVVAGVLDGFKAVVVAIVFEALVKISRKALKRRVHYVIAAAAFVAIYFLHVPFPLIVLGAAVIGLLGSRFAVQYFAADGRQNADAENVLSNNKIDLIEHRPQRANMLKTVFAFAALWSLPFVALLMWRGADSLFVQEYKFFSVSALVTFGGAYAVLAYVTQAVTTAPYNWITPTQAVDGLALAETTPGPLIMVLQFIGFMAGWNNPQPDLGPLASGVIGALITTYATFLPSFFFIFLGAPYIEKLRGNRLLTGSLSGVTAAVVGVILNLALVFGVAVIFPSVNFVDVNWFAIIVGIFAFIALVKFKIDALWVVLAGGIVGLARVFLTG